MIRTKKYLRNDIESGLTKQLAIKYYSRSLNYRFPELISVSVVSGWLGSF